MSPDKFEMKRLIRLITMELRLNATGIFLGAVALFCVLTARWILSESVFGDRFLASDYGFFLLTGGLFLASLAFSDMTDTARAQAFLMLPASRLEKYLSRYLLTSWLTAAAGLAVYCIFFMMTLVLHRIYPEGLTVLIHPFRDTLLRAVLYFIALHSAFFLGSLYFRRWAFPKTIICTALFSFFLLSFASGLGRLLYRNEFFTPDEEITLFSYQLRIVPGYMSRFLFIPFGNFLQEFSRVFLACVPFWLLPPLFLLTGYYRFGEIEQTHGIS